MTQKTLYLALYKGNREGWGIASIKARFGDWVTRKITRGIYSHCEIAYPLFVLNTRWRCANEGHAVASREVGFDTAGNRACLAP